MSVFVFLWECVSARSIPPHVSGVLLHMQQRVPLALARAHRSANRELCLARSSFIERSFSPVVPQECWLASTLCHFLAQRVAVLQRKDLLSLYETSGVDPARSNRASSEEALRQPRPSPTLSCSLSEEGPSKVEQGLVDRLGVSEPLFCHRAAG